MNDARLMRGSRALYVLDASGGGLRAGQCLPKAMAVLRRLAACKERMAGRSALDVQAVRVRGRSAWRIQAPGAGDLSQRTAADTGC